VRRVEELQHLDVVEGLSQGVHARVFLKDLKVVGKAQEDRPSILVEGQCREAVT
jgi:hypothetical protein